MEKWPTHANREIALHASCPLGLSACHSTANWRVYGSVQVALNSPLVVPNVMTGRYDFNKPSDVPVELHHTFDCVVIDPPFITREVWEKYAETARLLLTASGKVIGTTVAENESMLGEILPGMTATKFKPSIPNLIYQYNLFTNYSPSVLCEANPEIPDDT